MREHQGNPYQATSVSAGPKQELNTQLLLEASVACLDQPWWEPGGSEGGPFDGGILYVKRKVGARSYADDPIGCRSLLSRALHKVHLSSTSPTDICFCYILYQYCGQTPQSGDQ